MPVPEKRRGSRLIQVFAIGLALIAVVALMPFILFAAGYLFADLLDPPCTEDDQVAWASVEHYVDLQPRGVSGEGAGCSASFTTNAPARRVLDHYEAALTAQGWSILERQDLDPSGTPPAGPPSDAGVPVEMEAMPSLLRATRGAYQFSLTYEVGWTGEELADGEVDWSVRPMVMVRVFPTD